MFHRNEATYAMNILSRLTLGAALLLLVMPSFAADLAVLRNGYSIRHERRQVMGAITRLFTGPDSNSYVDVPTDAIEHFEPDLAPPPAQPSTPRVAPSATGVAPPLTAVVSEVSDRHHLDPDLVNSVIHAESGFNPHAISPKGARGLMQLMPQTASQLGVKNVFDPGANVEGGTKYLRELLERYNFDLIKALAAYNAGPSRVQQYRGVPPYYETRAYVARIIRDYNQKKLAERKAAAEKAKRTNMKRLATAKASQTSAVQQATVHASQ